MAKRRSPFWRKAGKTLGKLKLELIEEKQITTETARAEPIWKGHLIEMTPSTIKKKEVWENKLQLNKVGDIVKTDGTPWTKEEVQAQIQESLEWGWNGLATITRCKKKTQISIETLLNEYEDIVKQIPEYIMQAARGNITTEQKDNNIASKILLKNGKPADTIMKKNGWKTGTPLGKRGEGITAPIEATPQKDLRKIQGGITKTITA